MVHKSLLKEDSFLKLRVPVAIALAVAVATGAATIYSLSSQPTAQNPSPTASDSVRAITALGRLEPKGEVIHLSAPASSERARIEKLLVKESDRVRAGQVIAILDSRDRLQVALKQAKQQVKLAQARLAQVRAGARTGEIVAQEATIVRLEAELTGATAAQEATIARLEAELRNAQVEHQRYLKLYQDGATSASTADSKRLTLETVREQINEAKATLTRILKTGLEQINEAKATLARIAEIRPTDVQEAQAEVDNVITTVERAQAELNLAYVEAPMDSQILKIHAWPGEVVGDEGVAELGQTDQMYVVAEVYETDVGKVHLGQRATVTSQAFGGKLQGTVAEVGLQIDKKDILDTDPAADIDARVVEVKIRLEPEDSRRVTGLTRLQVKVAIDI